MQVWVNAWLFSSLLSSGIYFFARRAQLSAKDCVLLAVAAFPAPLFLAVGGRNSCTYALDIVTPVALWYARPCWKYANRQLRFAAATIFIGAGVSPLLISALFSGDRYDLMFAAMNLYRLTGTMALMLRCNACRPRTNDQSRNWLYIFSWIAVVIAAAMAAQYFVGINSDLYSASDVGYTSQVERGAESFFYVLGLFRGSIGIFGALAVCAYAAHTDLTLRAQLLVIAGGIAGFGVIIFSGSKTSLVICVGILGLRLLALGVKHGLPLTIVLVAILGLATIELDIIRPYLPRGIMFFIDSKGAERASLDDRTSTWAAALESVAADPLILFGVARRNSMPQSDYSVYLPSYYHNEYIGVVMLGGIYSFLLYLTGICTLIRLFWRGRGKGSRERFAFLAIAASVAHAWTVCHIQPSLLFGSTVSMLAATYGYCASPHSPKANALPLKRVWPAFAVPTSGSLWLHSQRSRS